MSTLTKTVKFMSNNLAEADASTVTYSSDGTNAAANLYNENLTTFWEPSGNWTIDDDNQNIYVNDGTFSYALALTKGDYTSATLVTELQAKLDTTLETFTVAYASNKFSITLTGSAATLEFSKQTNALWKDIGFTVETDLAMVTSDVSTGITRYHGQEYIQVDFGSNANAIGFFSLVGPHNEDFSLTKDAVIGVKMDNVPDNWESAAYSAAAKVTTRGVFHFVDASDCKYRYARFEIKDQLNADLKFSYFYAGDYLPISNRNVTVGYQKARVDPSAVQETESGRRYFSVRDRYEQWNGMSIEHPNRAIRLFLEQMWHDFGQFKPFFISIDPTTNISDDLGELTRFVYFNSQVTFNHVIRDLYNVSFTVRDVI